MFSMSYANFSNQKRKGCQISLTLLIPPKARKVKYE